MVSVKIQLVAPHCHYRMEAFVSWMDSVEESVQQLEEQTLSTNEYKQTLAKFQVRSIYGISSHH